MDIKKMNVPSSTITRDINVIADKVGNIYEAAVIIAKRTNQISVEIKSELDKKLQEFSAMGDNVEEVFENREQIEISRYYEKLPKPTLIAIEEFMEDKIYYRNPIKDKIK
jgi:DNA-directed RNA polymerase subunit K/omega